MKKDIGWYYNYYWYEGYKIMGAKFEFINTISEKK